MSFSEFGIPDENKLQGFQCHASQAYFVAHFLNRGRPHFSSVWVRKWSDDAYRPLRGESWTGLSYEAPVLHPDKPILFVLEWQHSPTLDSNGNTLNGFNWNAVESVDIETGESVSRIEAVKHDRTAWVSELYCWSSSANTLLAQIAFEVHQGQGCSQVEYRLCHLDPETGDFITISDMPGVYL